MRIALVVLACAGSIYAADSQRHPFETLQVAEAVAELEMQSPGADWALRGREAAVAAVTLDGTVTQHVMLTGGPEKMTYRVSLGRLQPGQHELTVRRDVDQSAAGAELDIVAVRVRLHYLDDPVIPWLSHSPVLLGRLNTIRRFSDVPLLMYCEPLEEDGARVLQYTVVFSNEDGGTSTRALMARWGRTTDIEYIYRVYLNADGSTVRRTVQGRGHRELEFTGPMQGEHPILMPVTDNNMVAEGTESPLRFQLVPLLVTGLNSKGSREIVMDDNPLLYRVMTKELEREGKLRKYGESAGENISHPSNYVHVEFQAKHRNSAFNVVVTLRDGRAFSSNLGRIDYSIERDGWARTAIELPPGSRIIHIASLAFECMVPPPQEKGGVLAHSGQCELERVGKLFFLVDGPRPSLPWFRMYKPRTVPTGQSIVFTRP